MKTFRIEFEYVSHFSWSLSFLILILILILLILSYRVGIRFPFQLELILNKADGGDISTYVPNGEWDLIGKINDKKIKRQKETKIKKKKKYKKKEMASGT